MFPPPRNWTGKAILWIESHAWTLAVLLIIIASARIAVTWRVFNVTIDEVEHIACGMEWLDRHTYTLEHQHPPLARVASALGPYLAGVRSQGTPDAGQEGKAILLTGGRLERNLTIGRAGILPFFWVACLVVLLWGKRLLGSGGGVLALLLFTNLPAILAHAALATTDMALTGMLGAALLATLYWVEEPSASRSVLLGVTGGLAIVSKFSSLPFFAVSVAGMLLWYAVAQPRSLASVRVRHFASLPMAIFIAAAVVWAAYRFSWAGPFRPAPEFFSGLHWLKRHNDEGHLAYLLGSFSQTGFRLYYPVALAVKTPIAFLVLLVAGTVTCFFGWRRAPEYGPALAFPAGILAFAMAFSRINIGIRHVLPVYIGFSIVAALGFLSLPKGAFGTLSAGALLAWFITSSVLAHPNYLAYFNEIAGSRPERILIDSDLDWGQDMKLLALRLRELKVTEFTYLPVVYLELAGAEFPPVRRMDIEYASPGWHAAHITELKLSEYRLLSQRPGASFWPERIAPVERVGRGILLWHLAAPAGARMTHSGK